jgi:hypothetical protein
VKTKLVTKSQKKLLLSNMPNFVEATGNETLEELIESGDSEKM